MAITQRSIRIEELIWIDKRLIITLVSASHKGPPPLKYAVYVYVVLEASIIKTQD